MSYPRVRTRGSPDFDSIEGSHIVTPNGGSSTSSPLEITDANGHYDWMGDVVTNGFQKRIAHGDIIVNPMTSTQSTRETSGTGRIYTLDSNLTEYAETIPKSIVNKIGLVSPRYIHMDLENLRTIAGTKAYADITSPEFQGLVFLAELREVVGFLRKPMSSLNNYLTRELRLARKKKRKRNKIHRSKLQHARKFSEHIGDNWLAYRYGLRPLVSDLENAARAVASLQFRPPPRFTARGKMDLSEELSFEDLVLGSSLETLAIRNGKTTRTVNVRAGVMYETSNLDTFGMNMQNIPIAAWEVIPFSFVADWFVNVGDYISAITPKLGVRVLGHWSSIDDKVYTSSTASGYAASGRTTTQAAAMDEVVTSRRKQRWRSCPVGLTTHPAPFRGTLGQKRVIDSFALLQQILSAKV